MELNSVGYGSAMTPEVQAQYGVKLIQMAKSFRSSSSLGYIRCC